MENEISKSEVKILWQNLLPRNVGKKFTLFTPRNFSENSKDAGFVHESLRNETNRVIWDFMPYETNPQNKSFENCVSKWIHETNLLKIASRNESAKRIFWKWLDSWSTIRNESFQVRIRDPRYESNLFKSGFAKRIHVFTNLLYDSRILRK
jgi:hypothetical protein